MPFPFDLKPVNYRSLLKRLLDSSYQQVSELAVDAWVTDEPVAFDARFDGVHTELTLQQPWGNKLFDCAWMRFTGVIPELAAGKKVALLIDPPPVRDSGPKRVTGER